MAHKLDNPDQDQIFMIRKAIRSTNRASLAVTDREDGTAYASLVMMGSDLSGHPLFLMSDLAEHSKNLAHSPKCSVLVDTTISLKTPLTGLRLTLKGVMEKCDDPILLNRYLMRHPDARLYASFGDFHLYRLKMEAVHLVAGFGKINWFDANTITTNLNDIMTLSESSADIIEHMNEDHLDAICLIARHHLKTDGIGWTMVGVDCDGLYLSQDHAIHFLPFSKPVYDANAVRIQLVTMTKSARAALC